MLWVTMMLCMFFRGIKIGQPYPSTCFRRQSQAGSSRELITEQEERNYLNQYKATLAVYLAKLDTRK